MVGYLLDTNVLIDMFKEYARLRVRLEQQGTPLDDFDLLIAATALQEDLTLVTANKRHFERIEGLRLEDWDRG